MYKFIEDKAELIKKKYKINYLAYTTGVSDTYISLILKGKRNCSKSIAYCLTKAIDKEAEVEEYFERVI